MTAIGRCALAAAVGLCMITGTLADDNTVTVTGKAEIKKKPDVAYVTLYVKGEGILMVDAAKKADQKVEEIKMALQEQIKGILAVEVSDVAVGEAQREYWGPDRKEESPRPEITRRLRITISPDPVHVYELVDVAIRAGALMQIPSTVHYSGDVRSVVVYGLLDSSGVEAEARDAAMADARKEAQSLAALAGKSLGDVVKVGCGGTFPSGFPVHVMGRQADYPTAYVGQNPSEIAVNYSLSVSFDMRKGKGDTVRE
ncbi:MAG TPA: SIMPL domain-containing protein [Kiritimatiellia bacterium]|nr:SIMPL domain-containing protein [Kiritimatiellia bacterium]HPA77336.1 SIMPL domain-containing protein [Kiritimatiellia bacterium]HQQ04371.1 SIMPL domain-containing protein [Kiritimatiellia bacterium]